jgi:hypothetical protein
MGDGGRAHEPGCRREWLVVRGEALRERLTASAREASAGQSFRELSMRSENRSCWFAPRADLEGRGRGSDSAGHR